MRNEAGGPPVDVDQLIRRVEVRDYVVGIIGLGYVGLPLLLTAVDSGFRVLGFDIDAIKVGARVEITDIEFSNLAYLQPGYVFRVDATNGTDFTFPAEARLGLGNGTVRGSNTQVGLYAQDDWDVTDRLQLNLGVRWDYETNGTNNDYVTPANAAAALTATRYGAQIAMPTREQAEAMAASQ